MPINAIASRWDRRWFLRLSGGLASALTACKPTRTVEPVEPSSLGKPLSAYGERSPFEKTARLPGPTKNPEIGASRTPLQDSYGILTPSALHFERHHSGVPRIDPAAHRLMLHGLVERPLLLTMDDIRRLPSVSRIHFIECGGNSGSEWGPKTAPDAQKAHGLASCSEWTGVPWDISVAPDGARLPEGSGTAAQGKDIYATKCAKCHGAQGQGGDEGPLAGGQGALRSPKPLKTVGSYWPYATTLFDYTNRAMPFKQPGTLTHNQVYAVVAHILHLNGIVGENDVMNAKTLPQVKMPNRNGFVPDPRPGKQ